MADRSMLSSFLNEILSSLRARDGNRITDLIQLDFESIPRARQKPYADLNAELNAKYPSNNDQALSQHCKEALPQDELGSFHSSFSESIVQYFRYLRDFNTADNQQKAREIRQLTSQCITALGDSKFGVIMIPIVLSFSRVLAKIATNLDRNPGLLKQTIASTTQNDEPGGSKVSFVESTANVLRDAFIKCLAGSPGSSRSTRPAPDDKRYGIYLTANSCLKLLWQCRKLRNAQQMFLSIDAQSPPLSFYPAAQRVTYLYYLGRYHFANNHFYRAQAALQSAYDQCHRDAHKHRGQILVYLITSNICLGRFPSKKLLARPEASTLLQHFEPLCRIIKSGDLAALDQYLDLSRGSSAQWFLQRRILLQLRDRCDILTWRSLIRKVFVVSGFKGEEKKIPFLRLNNVLVAAQWVASRSTAQLGYGNAFSSEQTSMIGHQYATQRRDAVYVDPEFVDIDNAVRETGFDLDSGTYNNEANHKSYSHHDVTSDKQSPTLYEVESVFLSLIQQGLLRGFVVHTAGNPRFAIPGSQAAGGPVPKGFPLVWNIVVSKANEGNGDVIPGWVKDELLYAGAARSGVPSLGGVVRLSGARPVGAES